MTKWLQSQKGTLFHFNHGISQMVFTDGSVMVMNTETKLITYIDKTNMRKTMPASLAVKNQDREWLLRIKYFRE